MEWKEGISWFSPGTTALYGPLLGSRPSPSLSLSLSLSLIAQHGSEHFFETLPLEEKAGDGQKREGMSL